jgi:hypothetical protein
MKVFIAEIAKGFLEELSVTAFPGVLNVTTV